MENSKISSTRVIYTIIMAAIFVAGTFLAAYINSILFDEFVCLVAVNALFFIVYILSLMKKRLKNQLPQVYSTSYFRATIAILVCWCVVNVFFKFPGFLVPIMILVAILDLVFDDTLALCLAIYFTLILCICQGVSIHEVIAYILLCVIGACIGPFFKDRDNVVRLFILMICFAVNVLIPIVFYYFTYLEINNNIFFYSLLEAFVVTAVFGIFFPLFYQNGKVRDAEVFENIISEDYPLVEDIRRYSYIEFTHAVRVSNLSRICAREIGANESIAACGGFYYRLGKMEGEPEIDNAIKVATDHCFPMAVISILAEYGGIIRRPSSRESAIVHMVDSIVTKIEVLDSDTMQSSWNQNMVIYQTINDLSQKGMYDESGLSMNQFLRVREKLASEDILS